MAIEVVGNPESNNVELPKVRKFRRAAPPTFTDVHQERSYRKGRLAMACRIVAAQGWGIGCSMQLSSRDPVDTSSIYVIPAGRALAAIRSSDLIRVNIQTGVVLDNDSEWGYDSNAVAIHRAIYQGRPDVGAIIHGHTPHARSFSMHNRELEMIVQDSCTFYKRFHRMPFSVGKNAASEPEAVADCLQTGKGFVMENRGILLVGATIECSISYYIRMESLCQIQLLAEAAIKGRGGDFVRVGEQEVQFTFDNSGSEHHAWLMAMPYFARQDRLTGGATVI
ncbi:class II aldolase/adducin N-terminal [Naematelia encephala]|uniref:Class II aldolase/adducin N-terminal n=1 Tax=Naematelia encephala TaxID=71784 RepID=A0A1Y2APL1_9TREE|nr:class II aldolase/adducin N-terminal [Naematelia encephala]